MPIYDYQDTTEVIGVVKAETHLSVMLEVDDGRVVAIPKSQIHSELGDWTIGEEAELAVSTWIAEKEDLG
jgi:hypothetical protein